MQATSYTETEEKIFLAALEIFSRHGKNGARMQEIADRAGINKALIHYYFRSKDRLYEEVFTFVIQRYLARMAQAMQASGESLEELMHTFIDRFIDMLSENSALPLFILREIAEGAPVMSEKIRAFTQPGENGIPEVFLTRFQSAMDSGEICEHDASQTLITLMGACIYFFAGYPLLATILPGIRENRDAYLQERKKHIFDILYYGLKPRPESHK